MAETGSLLIMRRIEPPTVKELKQAHLTSYRNESSELGLVFLIGLSFLLS